MPRSPVEKCNVSWENRVGTTTSGNLPQFKVGQSVCEVNIENITYPDVKLSDFRVYHIKCPYSTQADIHMIRNTTIGDPDYFKMNVSVSGSLSDHVDTGGIMIRENFGSVYGWTCVDDNCEYYTSVSVGQRYFYR